MSNLKPSTVLKRARKLIERGWCKRAWARTADGSYIKCGPRTFTFRQKEAAQFCVLGAIYRAANVKRSDVGAGQGHVGGVAQRYFRQAIDGRDPIDFNNDAESVEPIVAALDRAMMLAEAEE